MELRPYQHEAIAGAREQLRRGAKRVLLTCPTGGGKTVIAAEIIRSAVGKGSRVLFLAHRRELIQQTCDKLSRFGVRHGVVMAGQRLALQQPVQVASVQTLIRRPGQLARVDLVFVDEAHHFTMKNTYAQLLGWWPNAKVVGLTATPWRLDGHGLADVFDAHVLARTPRELRDEGFLVPVGGWEYEGIDTSSARVRNGDFVAHEMTAAATERRLVGDIVAEWRNHAGGARTVLFAVSIEHSQMMVAEFQKAGVAAEHIDGEMPTVQRDQVLARLRAGVTTLVSNCNVLTEGFDCPELECCVLARPTLSTSLYLQMVGRVLRPSPGKAMARIHDHAGCLAAHGHPFAERDYSPETSSRAERKAVDKAGSTKRCPGCKSVYARWPCDSCGFAPTPQELKLEYEEVARRNAITAEGTAPSKPKDSDADRRRRWELKFAHDEEWKRNFLARMVLKHGVDKGVRTYRWFSGFAESPRPEWVSAARELMREGFPA